MGLPVRRAQHAVRRWWTITRYNHYVDRLSVVRRSALRPFNIYTLHYKIEHTSPARAGVLYGSLATGGVHILDLSIRVSINR